MFCKKETNLEIVMKNSGLIYFQLTFEAFAVTQSPLPAIIGIHI
jgi:hypothetical protein